jgi:hypothetical protein
LFEVKETEVVVIFYDKLDPVLKILEEYEAEPVAGFAESEIRAANVSKV